LAFGSLHLLLGAFAAAQGGAPEQGAKPDERQQIIVTGERVKRSLKDTQSSVAIFNKGDLKQLPALDRLQQLLEFVPNVLQLSSRDTPVIRGQISAGVLAGLPAFLGGARPRTVVQIDGRTITFNEFSNSAEGLWDVDRVEVFRSPQTTTQGVNSIAGAIFITTADPTYRPEARARVIAGEYARRQVSGVLSAPLADDQLAFRVAGDLYRSDAADRMVGPVEGVDLNKDDYGTARVKLLAEPRALPGLRILMTYSQLQSNSPQGEGARPPFSDRRDIPCICGYFKVNVNSLTTQVTYPLSITLESRTTLDWGRTSFRRFAVKGFGQTHIHGRDRSLESVLEWKPSEALDAIAGLALQATDLDQFIDLSVTPFGTGTFEDRQNSSGLFGEVTWRPAAGLSLSGGMRYQSDRKRRIGVLHTAPDLPLDYDKTSLALLPKISAGYDLTKNIRVGVLVEKAYNPGGVTLAPARFAVVQFDPERLWDYEAFIRASFFGGALSVTGNLFYNDIRNAQRTLAICLHTPTGCVGLQEVSNAPRAHSSGAELELSYAAGSRLTLRTSGGWLRTRITRTLLPNDPILGKEFAAAPRFTGVAAIDWKPLANFRISSQVRHNSGFFNDDAETAATRIRPSTTVDARLSWQTGRFTIFGYGQNLFDEFHVTAWGDLPSTPDIEVGTNDPRELGIGIEARF
jgi:iron complex outermembrane recepter protein